ncbi:pilus assembly protein TadG-related protein [Arthrobacter sp. M4]|uniref:pilus assembly protein TadG-related protein n=1 Tax=Arthrobacter sp. M4 TaxID=218160 RepID=UPI0027DF96FC|nr:pilus assembly protein TadG-related protein [Arthrobacter sp. M4]
MTRAQVARNIPSRAFCQAHPHQFRPHGHGEEGQIMVMVLGYLLLGLLLATVVIAVSAVYIEHKKLLSAADSAAVAAADSYTLGQVTGAGGAPAAVLSSDRVRGSTYAFLERTGAFQEFDGLAVAPETGSSDSASAEVVLTAVVRPPIVNFLVPEGVPIEAASTARSRLTR